MKVDCRRIFGHHSTIAKKKKELGFSEDAVFMVEKWLKQEMDEVIAKADSLVKEKQAEVLDTSRSWELRSCWSRGESSLNMMVRGNDVL